MTRISILLNNKFLGVNMALGGLEFEEVHRLRFAIPATLRFIAIDLLVWITVNFGNNPPQQ